MDFLELIHKDIMRDQFARQRLADVTIALAACPLSRTLGSENRISRTATWGFVGNYYTPTAAFFPVLKGRYLELKGRYKATWKTKYKLPWREAGPPDHHDDKVVSDQ